MSEGAAALRGTRQPAAGLFVASVFTSAGLVFLAEPMVAKLVLPRLGGSPAVWNTSLAFFQAALLVGYGYAHLLQRLVSLRTQAAVHGAALLLAALALPLRIHEAFGPPSVEHPVLWLLGVLVVSIGAPFAVLSATAPLIQAWHARSFAAGEGGEPYALYAASNLGSLLALLAYPLLVEPHVTLTGQRLGWSAAYGCFVLLIAAVALGVVRHDDRAVAAPATKPASWADRLAWTALAAAPSSLMLGVTAHLATDVASAPFLWVAPLALYLAAFVVAFARRPPISRPVTLALQAATAAACAAILPFSDAPLPAQFAANVGAFFFTTLMCCQALVARRPHPEQLTDFYLWISIGGVLGGAFNAFVAPLIFKEVWEYPLVLVLSALARPWAQRTPRAQAWVMLGLAIVASLAAMVLASFRNRFPGGEVVGDVDLFQLFLISLLTAAAIAAVRLRQDALLFCAALAAISIGANEASERATTTRTWRSFFGVLRITEASAPALGGRVRMLSHGTTLHGAEALHPAFRCRPLVYYTPATPIGQVFQAMQASRPTLRIGAVGLGTGSVAAYVRASDRLTFFEIDPLVVQVAADPRNFSYIAGCARGRVDFVVGDARLSLAGQPAEAFDILLIDAFSSDAVPAHLLTVEALRSYLARLKPDGVLVLHLSNRHLELIGPAQAAAAAADAVVLVQRHRVQAGKGRDWESDEDAVLVGRSAEALAAFARDPRWRSGEGAGVRPWTDDYVNVPGALWRKLQQNRRGRF